MTERPIASIRIGTRHRKDVSDVRSLAASIERDGLLHPVVITPDGRLVAGERRVQACAQLGWHTVPVRVLDVENIVRAEAAENFERQDFTPSEAVAIRRSLEPEMKAEAEARMKAGQPSENFSKGRAADKASALTGYSRFTLDKAESIVAAAEAEPEKYGRLVEDMDRTERVNGVWRRFSNMQQAERIRTEPPPLPTGPYRVATIDIPWPYELRAEDPSHRGICPYPTMSIPEVCALPIPTLMHADAVLWMWVPNFHLMHGQQKIILDAWGFEQKALLTWVKDKMGFGDWLRAQTEQCVMAIRGKPATTLTNQTTALSAPMRAHSEKPDEFYALVESLCPAPAYLELFARKPRPGWVTWGDEVPPPAVEPATACPQEHVA